MSKNQLKLQKFSVPEPVHVQGAKWTPPPPAPKPKPMLIVAMETEEQLIQLYMKVYGSREEAQRKIAGRLLIPPMKTKTEFTKQEILTAVFMYEMNKHFNQAKPKPEVVNA